MRLPTFSLLGLAALGILVGPSPAVAAGGPAARPSEWRTVTIPAGTSLPVVLDSAVGSDISRVEQPVHGHLARTVSINGVAAIPRGSNIAGVVTNARRPGKVKGRGYVAIRFNSLQPTQAERYRIETRAISRLAPATKKDDALKIGLPAAGGAAVGALVGGKEGAAIGAAAGGGAGTAVVLSTRGKDARLARGSLVTVRLTQAVHVKVRS